MEKVIWEGKASPLSCINMWDVILTLLTVGFWLIVPLLKMIALMSKSYRITNERIIIKEGLVSTSENEVEYYRVKGLSVNQNMIQKILGLGDITVQTSDIGGALQLKGIPNAYQLREQMRASVNDTRKENNVRVSERI